jgi:hypothetical protein
MGKEIDFQAICTCCLRQGCLCHICTFEDVPVDDPLEPGDECTHCDGVLWFPAIGQCKLTCNKCGRTHE